MKPQENYAIWKYLWFRNLRRSEGEITISSQWSIWQITAQLLREGRSPSGPLGSHNTGCHLGVPLLGASVFSSTPHIISKPCNDPARKMLGTALLAKETEVRQSLNLIRACTHRERQPWKNHTAYLVPCRPGLCAQPTSLSHQLHSSLKQDFISFYCLPGSSMPWLLSPQMGFRAFLALHW